MLYLSVFSITKVTLISLGVIRNRDAIFLNHRGTQNHLMECLLADVTLVCLLTRMREAMVFIVALLVETFPAKFTNVRPISLMYPHMRVESRAPIKSLPTSSTFMWLIRCVNDFVPA